MYLLLALCLIGAVSGRQPAAPQHSADHLPDTQFSCRDKVLGGYYADPDAQCQMFHVCVKVAGVGIQDFRFLCPNGTAFDQEAQICAGWADVACDTTALYYSSDNFDLYRIGSGFESKKAPVVYEDEQDFHLQRAEPDILSGAHSSNFFNNREGKDNQEAPIETGGRSKNQFDQSQKKKVVRKLQRRPAETSPRTVSTSTKQFTNNFAGSYVPTTSRAVTTTTTTTSRPTTTTSQYTENYNNYNQRTNNYNQRNQSFRQSSTAAPVEYKSTNNQNYNVEQTTANNKYNRNFKSRQQTTPEYNYNTENDKQKSSVNYNDQYNKQQQYNNYQDNQYNNQQTTQKSNYNQDRRQQYDQQKSSQQYNQEDYTKYNQQTTPKQKYDNQPSSPQYNQDQYTKYNQQTTPKQTSPSSQYNQDYTKYNNQQTTPKNNYNNENIQKSTYQPSTNFNYKNTQQSNQQYNNAQTTVQQNYNPDDIQFDKVKSTTKFNEKKQYSAKQSTQQYNYNDNKQQNQTPTPKYNTNLQYDNNQQSTPFYNYNNDYTQQQKSTTYEPQYSTSAPSFSSRGSTNYQQYQTTSNNYNQKVNEQKTTSVNQQYTTVRSTNNVNFKQQQSTTIAPVKSHKEEDYDDGQYHPELYEREAGGEYDINARKNRYEQQQQQRQPQPVSRQEPELLKAAHSINIAASGNELARNNRPQVPITTFSPVSKVTKGTTQPPRTIYTTQSPKSVYSSIAVVTSNAPRPFSLRPTQSSTIAPVQKTYSKPIPDVKPQVQHSTTSKPEVQSKNGKDVSYDYAYYDNTDHHYSEYENIEEFGRTSKKQ